MSVSKSFSHRRAASSFVNDATDLNLIQLSPHKEQRSPYTMTTNQESRTNFIGDSIIPTEIPRAFAVTKTGEKQILDLDFPYYSETNSNPFTQPSPRYSAPAMEKISEISEKSVSDYSLNKIETKHKSGGKSSKRAKSAKCNVNKKHRLVFTPRNLEHNSSAEFLLDHYETLEPIKTLSKITSTQTQTDNLLNEACGDYKPRHYNNLYAHKEKQSVPKINSRCNEVFTTDPLRSPNIYRTATDLPVYAPLKIYTKTNPNLGKYSELRAIASAVTLITVISWLFLTFFDIECLWNYLDSLWQYLRYIFAAKEKPKTKIEIFVDFLQDMFS